MSQADNAAINHDLNMQQSLLALKASVQRCAPPTRPPMYPTSPKIFGCSLLEKENIRDTSVRRFVPEEMRDVPVLSHRIAKKAGNRNGDNIIFSGNFYGTSSLLEELESVLIYVESVTASLSRGMHVPVAPDDVRVIPSSLTVQGCESPHDALTHRSLAMDLYYSANKLLDCFAKIDKCASCFQDETLGDVEKEVNAAASDVNIALDAVEQRYRSHTVEDVREFFIGNEQTIEECRRHVRDLLQAAQQIIALRLIVRERDVTRAEKLFAQYRKECFQRNLARLPGSFFYWIEEKWFPAMEAWKRIVNLAHEQAEIMDIQLVIAEGKKETFAQSDLISEILHPGESLSDLVREQLERPLSLLVGILKRKHDCLEALRTSIAMPNLKTLMEHVCALDEIAATCELKSVADRKLIREGKRLIISLQQVENLDAALRLATQVGETVTLFRTIHHANEILLNLGIAGDVAANRKIVAQCGAILTEMANIKCVSPAEFIARRVDIGHIIVPHLPSQVWTKETTALYQAACQSLTARIAQDLVRFDLERILKNGDVPRLSAARSASGDDTSTASSATHSPLFVRSQSQFSMLKSGCVQELRAALKRACEVGLNCQLVQEGKAYLCSIEVLKLKIHFEAQLRVLFIHDPVNVTFDEIYKRVYDLCMEQTAVLSRPVGKDLRLRYQDKDGDCISLLTQEDWNIFITEEAPNGVCGAKLELFCDFLLIPYKHVTDELLETPPLAEVGGFLDASLFEVTAEGTELSVPKDTLPKASSPSAQQRESGAATAKVNDHNNDNDICARNSLEPTCTNDADIKESSSVSSLRIWKTRRVKPDDAVSRTVRVTRGPNGGATDNTRANLVRSRSVQKRSAQRPVVEKPCSNTPVRSKVYSIRVGSPVFLQASKRKLPACREMKQQPPPLIKGTFVKTSSNSDVSLTQVASSLCTAPSPTSMKVSSGSNPQKSLQSKRKTPPPRSKVSESLEMVPVKRWNEDDVQLELQTVASVASVISRPVINIKRSNTPGERAPEKQQSKKIPVVSTCNNSKTTVMTTDTKVVDSLASGAQKTSGATALDKKDEWDANMFMECGFSTTAGEREVARVSIEKYNEDQQLQQSNVTNSFQPSDISSAAEAVVPVSQMSKCVKEKTELLQKLKQLREENQKALKAALIQKRASK